MMLTLGVVLRTFIIIHTLTLTGFNSRTENTQGQKENI